MKTATRFLLLLTGIYLLLFLMWPLLQRPFDSLVSGIGNTVCPLYVPKAKISIDPAPQISSQCTKRVLLINKKQEQSAMLYGTSFRGHQFPLFTKELFYIPLIFLTGLICAAPLSWKVKGITLGISMLVFVFYMLFILWVVVGFEAAQQSWLHITAGPQNLVRACYIFFIRIPATKLILMFFIALVLLFPKLLKQSPHLTKFLSS